MKVVVDARSLASGRGVARYTAGILRAGAHDVRWDAVVPGTSPVAAAVDGVQVTRTRLPSQATFALAAATGRPRLDHLAGGADVAWLPTVAPVALSRGLPYVVTVHDLSFLRRPGDFTPYERAWHRAARVDRLVGRAGAVVCDTPAVADEVRTRWPASASRVHVVTPGVDRPLSGGAAPAGLPDRFLLFVGALEPRKAPEVLAAAFAEARARGLDAGLVVIGGGRLACALTGPGIHHLGSVDDATLHAVYGRALAVVQPSYLEGFGLPPLEAALHDVPSVVSDLPVFAQTIADGAMRVPAGDPQALADALLRIAADPALRTRMAAAGALAAGPMTWERAAAQLVDLLRAVSR